MRNISFMLTTEQFRNRSKSVTRRMGWLNVKPGEVLMGVEKSQGLKKGEKIVQLGKIRVSTRREKLRAMRDDPVYGAKEVIREGFPQMSPAEFVEFFCRSHKGCTPETEVTRIEFEYL